MGSHQPVAVTVVVPSGLLIRDAAGWVGGSCWAELAMHQYLTEVLAGDGLDPERRVALWAVRANRARAAHEWHQRLPELAEMARAQFVLQVDDWPALAGPTQVDAGLAWLAQRYQAHRSAAVGPADAPVAATLMWAERLVTADRRRLAELGS